MTTPGTIPRRVFVLGAGFTKAFVPNAPGQLADFDNQGRLQRRFRESRFAHELLELEMSREKDEKLAGNARRINLERLMTRLESGMPYDESRAPRSELLNLLDELKRQFIDRFATLTIEPKAEKDLLGFARYCISNQCSILTLNYDDLLDWALWQGTYPFSNTASLTWKILTGYGFTCPPSEETQQWGYTNGPDPMYLLKLHGSFNWRTPLGHIPPLALNTIVHHTPWIGGGGWKPGVQMVRSLDPRPFIVPPILTKAAFMQEPVLRVVWTRAYDVLAAAKEVVFLGYSLPVTDLAAQFLFREAIPLAAKITVVVRADSQGERQRIQGSYQDVLGRKELRFEKAPNNEIRKWIRRDLSRSDPMSGS